jgi:N-acetylglucosamine-6-phosphate deacetylase
MKRLHGRAFVRGALERDTLITIDGETIVDVTTAAVRPADAHTFDGVILPGFIDVHVHGGDGADVMDADPEALSRITRFHARRGTTALAATTLSASRHDLLAAVKLAARFLPPADAAEVVAIHLEGPYINPERAGAHDRGSIRPPDIGELAALLAESPQLRWIVTVAPEIAGARELIEHFRERVTFSIGHTSGNFADAAAAIVWGASHFTHLFNAMTPLQHREPGVVGAAMVSEDATVELIADGIHVHQAVLRIAARMMLPRVALVTDAMRACGLADGNYKLYDYDVSVIDGAARLANGTLAGSVLTMDRAVRNMVELAGLPLEAVVPLATEVPARITGVAERKGRISAGYDADLVVMNDRLEVEQVFVRGMETGSGR